MDKNGLRITPGDVVDVDHPAWFFGGSFTIGEGVNNEDALPYLYAVKTGVKTYNFGFHGYGPHQMLRMLETTYIADIDASKPSIVFYNAISMHIDRAAGLVPWDKDGPNYVINDDTVKFAGKFSDKSIVSKYMDQIAEKSFIYSQVIRPLIFVRQDSDRDRYVGIVKASADLIRDRYQSKLVVVLWDIFGDRSAAIDVDSNFIEEELSKRGVDVVMVSEALGQDFGEQYYIQGDGHPTALAFDKVATFLAKKEFSR